MSVLFFFSGTVAFVQCFLVYYLGVLGIFLGRGAPLRASYLVENGLAALRSSVGLLQPDAPAPLRIFASMISRYPLKFETGDVTDYSVVCCV